MSGDIVEELYRASLNTRIIPVEDVYITAHLARNIGVHPPIHDDRFTCGEMVMDDCDLVQVSLVSCGVTDDCNLVQVSLVLCGVTDDCDLVQVSLAVSCGVTNDCGLRHGRIKLRSDKPCLVVWDT